jgi:hypothetical protein
VARKVTEQDRKRTGGRQQDGYNLHYNQEWSDKLINSSNFKHPNGHQNPGVLPYESIQMVTDKVTLGAFTLSPSLVNMIDNYETLPVSSDTRRRQVSGTRPSRLTAASISATIPPRRR